MLLDRFLMEFYLPSRIELSRDYARFLSAVCADFSAWLNRPATIDDLTEANVCRYLGQYRQRWSASSTNNRRAALRMLHNEATGGHLQIRKLKCAPDPPVAWTIEEVARLLEASVAMHGRIAGVPAGRWWFSLLLTIYWTACRIGSLLAVESQHYRRGKGLLVRKQKNRIPQFHPLPLSCCEAIDATWPTARRLLWPWDQAPKKIFGHMRWIVETSGIDDRPGGRMLFHRLRRTSISYCAAVDPAIAQRTAGHADYATTLRSYVDPLIAHQRTAADVLPDPLAKRFSIYQ